MRRNFVFFVLIPLVVCLAVTYFFIDRWVESGLETAGEQLTGARVDIDDLHVSLSPLAIQFVRMQVADPQNTWTNLFETRRVRFALNTGQFLRGRYIIETMEVNDLLVGTKRSTDGSLPGGRSVTAGSGRTSTFSALALSAFEQSVGKTPIFDPAVLRRGLNVDSLIKAVGLRSVAHIETLRTQAIAASQQWSGTLADIENAKRRLAEIDSSLRLITPASLKDVAAIAAAITTVDNARQSVNAVVTTFTARQASVTADIERLSASVGAIEGIAAEDYRKILSVARLPDVSAMGLAGALFGKQLKNDVTRYLHYVDWVREHIPATGTEPEMQKPPRMKGQDVHFHADRAYPHFWIRNIIISGGTDPKQDPDFFYAKGQVKNITNDQRITRLPLTIDLTATRGDEVRATVSGLFDRTKDTPLDEYKATITGVPLAAFEIGSPDFLPATITGARLGTGLYVSIPGNRFDSRMKLDFRNLAITYATRSANVGERLAREVLDGVRGFGVDLRLWDSSGRFKMALSTDLDEQFAARIKAVLGAELNRLQAELRAKVYAIINEKRREFETVYNAKRAEVERQLGEYQALVNEKIALVDAKKQELTDRLEREKKGKIDDVMKKLFKK